jgi:hypothetical protein
MTISFIFDKNIPFDETVIVPSRRIKYNQQQQQKLRPFYYMDRHPLAGFSFEMSEDVSSPSPHHPLTIAASRVK